VNFAPSHFSSFSSHFLIQKLISDADAKVLKSMIETIWLEWVEQATDAAYP
jgi:hypothetical protein